MSSDRYPSVPERITWTTGFRVATDKAVLGFVSTFANFKTGKRADMALETLMQRAQMPRRTLIRSLGRLESDGWIVGRRRHRRPTVYDICVERLATHWTEAKPIESLGATGGTQEAVENFPLSATGDRLGATGGTQDGFLSATGGTPSPVRTDPQVDPHALRARVSDQDDETTKNPEAKVEPHQPTLGLLVDVSAPPVRSPQWGQLADLLRTALDGPAKERKSG